MDTLTNQNPPRRNAPCPCGSGKKYKQCCGALGADTRTPNASPAEATINAPSNIDTGFALYNQGDLAGALSIASGVIKSDPEIPEAYVLKGMCNYVNGNLGEARQDFMRADELSAKLEDSNDISSIKLSLSTIALDLGNSVEAEDYARNAIKLGLNTFESHKQLGAALAAQKKFKESIESFDKAIEFNRQNPQLWVNKGSCHYFLRDLAAAVQCFQEALNVNPDYVPALMNLAAYYYREKEYDIARELLEKIENLEPENIKTLVSLAIAYMNLHRNTEARNTIEKAFKKQPKNPEVISIFFDILANYENPDFSAQCELTEQILADPELEDLKVKTLGVLEKTCDFERREEVLRWVRDIGKSKTENIELLVNSIPLLSLNYTNTISCNDVLRLHKLVGEYNSKRITPSKYSHHFTANDTNSRIRIGYVSADFREHSVGYFIRNIIKAHDTSKYDIYCYASLEKKDALTDEIINHASQFRDITKLSDEKAAALINSDGIQILVDLGGHTQNNRLPVFIYKPAPIQLTYLGYPNTTGLREVDYRITDATAEDIGGTQYTEELLYMPESFLCAGGFSSRDVDPISAFEKNGYITFGSFNAVSKLNSEVIRTWSEIMHLVSNSVINLKGAGLETEVTRKNILSEFERNGIAQERVQFQAFLDKNADHLNHYNNIDIALDTFPYNGTTTTCEALWMSVPVVTLIGKKHVQRVSYSILKNIGHEELAAKSAKEYVDIASRLAANPDYLRTLRSKISIDFSSSILCNPEKFTGQLEGIYSSIWSKYLD